MVSACGEPGSRHVMPSDGVEQKDGSPAGEPQLLAEAICIGDPPLGRELVEAVEADDPIAVERGNHRLPHVVGDVEVELVSGTADLARLPLRLPEFAAPLPPHARSPRGVSTG